MLLCIFTSKFVRGYIVLAVFFSSLSCAYNIPEIKHSLVEFQDEIYKTYISMLPSSNENRVISFALYGNDKKYTYGAVRNAEIAPIYYPGWTVRFYVDENVNKEVINLLKELHAEIYPIPIPEGDDMSFGMLWRFSIAGDESVDRYVIRDVDSRLNTRERLAVQDWIESGFPLHVMRDHPYHVAPIMGGMWGGVKGALPSIVDRINSWPSKKSPMADMKFLEEVYWESAFKNNSVAHDSFSCRRYLGTMTRPFPTPRNEVYQHVGQVFDYRDRKYPESIVELSKEVVC